MANKSEAKVRHLRADDEYRTLCGKIPSPRKVDMTRALCDVCENVKVMEDRLWSEVVNV